MLYTHGCEQQSRVPKLTLGTQFGVPEGWEPANARRLNPSSQPDESITSKLPIHQHTVHLNQPKSYLEQFHAFSDRRRHSSRPQSGAIRPNFCSQEKFLARNSRCNEGPSNASLEKEEAKRFCLPLVKWAVRYHG